MIAVILVLLTVIGTSVAVCLPKHDDGELYTYISPDGKVFEYYIDGNGKAYNYDGDNKVYLGPIIPKDVFGKNMTSPYVYSTTEPSSGELNSAGQS